VIALLFFLNWIVYRVRQEERERVIRESLFLIYKLIGYKLSVAALRLRIYEKNILPSVQ
jgi:hypothetical protein